MTATRISTEEIKAKVVSLVQERIEDGISLPDASEQVRNLAVNQGWAADLLLAFGDDLIAGIWQRYRVAHSRMALWRTQEGGASTAIEPVESKGPLPTRAPCGEIDQPEALLEVLWLIDGQWVTLGDMTSAQNRSMRLHYEGVSDRARTKAQFFKRLEEATKDGGTNRDKFTEASLRALREELGA